jgi:hypothetical protein
MLRWDIYRAAAKAKWIGTVEAVDADAAIKDAAKEFNIEDPKKLIAVPQRWRPFTTADRVRRHDKTPAPFSRPSCGSGHP